jgi:nucleotide-binding universal stress UspA family protein
MIDDTTQGPTGPDPAEAPNRAGGPDGPFRHILVAVDDTDPSAWAVDAAGPLAAALGARVALLHVVVVPVNVSPELVIDLPSLRAQLGAAAGDLLASLQARLPASVSSDRLVRDGTAAADVIVQVANDWPADLIVIGTRGRGRIAQFILGSTAEEVVRRAPCPVLTVAHPPKGLHVAGGASAGASAGAATSGAM